jgi:hypothetical protein
MHLVRCDRSREIKTQHDLEKADRRREEKRLQLELDKAEQEASSKKPKESVPD